jgi:hypothetical protein
VETSAAFHVLPVSALGVDVDAERTRVFPKADLVPALDAAMQCRTATIFLDFARFPWGYAIPTAEGFDVTLRDLRFISLESRKDRFVVDIKLDKDLHVRSERFRFSRDSGEAWSQSKAEGDEGASARLPAALRRARIWWSSPDPTTKTTTTSDTQVKFALR